LHRDDVPELKELSFSNKEPQFGATEMGEGPLVNWLAQNN
jgi:hypothetical protein